MEDRITETRANEIIKEAHANADSNLAAIEKSFAEIKELNSEFMNVIEGKLEDLKIAVVAERNSTIFEAVSKTIKCKSCGGAIDCLYVCGEASITVNATVCLRTGDAEHNDLCVNYPHDNQLTYSIDNEALLDVDNINLRQTSWDKEYECPLCGFVIANSKEDAVKFLKGETLGNA